MMFREICGSGDAELISLLLETGEDELDALERLYTATREIRANAASPEERDQAIGALLDGDARLRADFRLLTGRTTLAKRNRFPSQGASS